MGERATTASLHFPIVIHSSLFLLIFNDTVFVEHVRYILLVKVSKSGFLVALIML